MFRDFVIYTFSFPCDGSCAQRARLQLEHETDSLFFLGPFAELVTVYYNTIIV